MKTDEELQYFVKVVLFIGIIFVFIFLFFWYEYVGFESSKERVKVTMTLCSVSGRGGLVCHSHIVRQNGEELDALSACSGGQIGNGELSIGSSLFSQEARYYVNCIED